MVGPMLRTNVVGTTGRGNRLLMLIHGYGADEEDLAPLASVLDPAGRFFAVCPRGPLEVDLGGGWDPAAGGGWVGAKWYDRSEDGVIDPGSLQRSIVALDHLLDELCDEHGFRRHESVIIGFSQGGAMALALSLRDSTKARPAGVACLSGMLQNPPWLRYAWDDGWPAQRAPEGFPSLYVQHGTHDPMVDVEQGRRTRDTLEAHGIAVEYHEYAMQHEIRPESIVDLRAWLEQVSTTVPTTGQQGRE